jgi:surface protein
VGVTFSATPAVKLKPQVYIAKGSSPWYNDREWPDRSKVTNTDESVSGQVTVTCKDVTNMNSMLYNCSNLTSLDLSNFITSSVTDMRFMFNDCSKLTSLDLSNFDTSKVYTMWFMFNDCNSLTSLDVTKFNTSNVTSMGAMFSGCSKLTTLDLSNFDTSNVTDMYNMFNRCSNLTTLDISNFDTSNVSDMTGMFYNCSNLTTIKGIIDMKSCKYYMDMFDRCPRLTDVKIKNPPVDFESKSRLSKSQYTIVS